MLSSPHKPICLSFLGTAEHRDTARHAVINFHQTIEAGQLAHTRLFDGVGSSPLQSGSAHPTPGTYVYDAQTDHKRPLSRVASCLRDGLQVIDGQLAGDGMEDLIREAILFIQTIRARYPETDFVNLHGFSRGADTCVRLANRLHFLYPELRVNLFLFDQVPGIGRRDDPDSYIIPANVQRMESALMLNEYRPGFDPQHGARYVVAAADKTRCVVLPFFGNHWAGILQSGEEGTSHTAKILHNRFLRFCRETGVLAQDARPISMSYQRLDSGMGYVLQGTPDLLSDQDVFTLYCSMMDNERRYASGMRVSTRSLLARRDEHVRDPDLFVNQEHRELFQRLYPYVFCWFFEGNSRDVQRKDLLCDMDRIPRAYQERLRAHFGSGPGPYGPVRDEQPGLGELPADWLRYDVQAALNYYTYHHRDKTTADNETGKALAGLLEMTTQQSGSQAHETLTVGLAHIGEHGFFASCLHGKRTDVAPDKATNYAADLIASLDAYLLRHRCWLSVVSAFHRWHVPAPELFSLQKHRLAERLRERAQALVDAGQGACLEENRNLLQLVQQGQRDLRSTERLKRDSLDNIIHQYSAALSFATTRLAPV